MRRISAVNRGAFQGNEADLSPAQKSVAERIRRYRALDLRFLRRADAENLLRECAIAAAYVTCGYEWECAARNTRWQDLYRAAAEMHGEIPPETGEVSEKHFRIREARNRARAEAQRRRAQWLALAGRAAKLAAGETGERKKYALTAWWHAKQLADDDDIEKWLPRLPEEPEPAYPKNKALLLHFAAILPKYRGREEDIRAMAWAEEVKTPAALTETIARWRREGGYRPAAGYPSFSFSAWRRMIGG